MGTFVCYGCKCQCTSLYSMLLLLWPALKYLETTAAFIPTYKHPTRRNNVDAILFVPGVGIPTGRQPTKWLSSSNPSHETTTTTTTTGQKQQRQQRQQQENDATTIRQTEPHHITRQCTFELDKEIKGPSSSKIQTKTKTSRWRRFFQSSTSNELELQRLAFSYDCNLLSLKAPKRSTDNNNNNNKEMSRSKKDASITTATTTTGVILIHPIGVGIGKWFYNRLLESLYHVYHSNESATTTNNTTTNHPLQNLIVAVPDLLGSGTACNPIPNDQGEGEGEERDIKQLPLLTVSDWSNQIGRLMVHLENDYPSIQQWCIVANGGCSPIALEVAGQSRRLPSSQYQTKRMHQRRQLRLSTETTSAHHDNSSTNSSFLLESRYFQRPVSNVVLSSVPRLPFFLPLNDDTKSRVERLQKVTKSYKTLCGIPGRLFWWYALRDNGAFIQSFSERNLVADAANLGNDWTPHCVATARMYHGKSRYSAFSFLAGSLQAEGCRDTLAAIRNGGIMVDVIQGRDRRRNRAKSWFWQRQKKKSSNKNRQSNNTTTRRQDDDDDDKDDQSQQHATLQMFLQSNGNRGEVREVGGRISLAHEDAPGYAHALMDLLALQATHHVASSYLATFQATALGSVITIYN